MGWFSAMVRVETELKFTGVEMITTLSYTGLMNGNMMLIDAVKDLPQDLQECTKASQDLEALEKWAATYLTPVDLI